MKCIVSTACVLSVLVAVSLAAPFPQGFSSNLQIGASASTGLSSPSTTAAPGGAGGLSNILSTIDLPGLLRGVNSFVKLVGVFCPPLSQVLDNVIQNVTSQAFRIFGRLILSGGLGGGGGASGSANGGGGQRVSVVLPTFPPDEEDYDEDDEDTDTAEQTSQNIDIKAFEGSSTTTSTVTTSASTTTAASTSTSAAPSETVVNTSTLYTSPASENSISKRHVRVVREADDQEEAESAPQPAEDLSNVEADDADRDKRFLPFGGSLGASGHASGGGSGNFLFDIIRLVAGSGATEDTDEKANAPGGVAEVDIAKSVGAGDVHSGEGIPGPITRLFVIANRGIANLVQDLILRLAQTSERLVNFKARLVTSLI